jgi:hypothetical protein
MNRLISIGLSIAVAPAIMIVYGKLTSSLDTVAVSSYVMFNVTIPIGALLSLIGLFVSGLPKISPTLSDVSHLKKVWVSMLSQIHYRTWFVISAWLFFFVLILPFETDSSGSSIGLTKLLWGWVYVLTFQAIIWLSFPLLFASLVCIVIKKSNAATQLAAVALFSALTYIIGPTLEYGWGEQIRKLEQHPSYGYFLFLIAIFAALRSSMAQQVSIQDETLSPDS